MIAESLRASHPFLDNERDGRSMSEREVYVKPDLPAFSEVRFNDVVDKVKTGAQEQAYKLIKTLMRQSEKDRPIKLITAESLTGGIIFSTLVDVPFGGAHKYGCFSTYDTDSKRIMLNVTEPDVYTHACASQMAVGALQNSNATIAIAVTGNSMPMQGADQTEEKLLQLGEVFIAVAGYVDEDHIVVDTKLYNFCDSGSEGNSMAKMWVDIAMQEIYLRKLLIDKEGQDFFDKESPHFHKLVDGYNEFLLTSQLSSYVRYKTTTQAYLDTIAFLNSHTNSVKIPSIITPIEAPNDPVTTKANIQTMQHIVQGIGSNILLRERNNHIVPVALSPHVDATRSSTTTSLLKRYHNQHQ